MRRGLRLTGATLLACLVVGCSGERMLPADTDLPTKTPAAQPTAEAQVLTENRDYSFPVGGDPSYAAAHHDYPAADIFAACGTPVLAPVSGTLVGVRRRDRYSAADDDPALRGGRSWTLLGDDGVRYYGSHLAAIDTSIMLGTWLRSGERIGRVGRSGNAAGIDCHLHFGISPACGAAADTDGSNADWWTRRGAVAPYPYLRAWQQGRDRSPAEEVARWQRDNGCPGPTAG